jgi:hypothetical protein
MTQNPRQVKKVPARSQVRHLKGVAQRMRGEANAGKSYSLPKDFKIALKIANRYASSVSGSENIVSRIIDSAMSEFEQLLTKLKAEGYESLFSTFAFNLQAKIFKVQGLAFKTGNLARRKAGIKNRKRNKVSSAKVGALKDLGRRAQKIRNLLSS